MTTTSRSAKSFSVWLVLALVVSLSANLYLFSRRSAYDSGGSARLGPVTVATADLHDAVISPERAPAAAMVSSTSKGQVNPRALALELQKAGVSPALIRAIVRAVVEVQFRDALAARIYPPGTKYWALYNRSQQAARVAEQKTIEAQMRAIEEEATAGIPTPDDLLTRTNRELQYGSMSADKAAKVQQILASFRDLQLAAGSTRAVNPKDRAQTLLAAQDERDEEIRAVLSPDEFRQFQLRQSEIASSVRGDIGDMDLSEAQYEALYDIRADSVRLYRGMDASTAQGNQLALYQNEIKVLDVIGGERGLALASRADSFAACLKAVDAAKLGTDVVKAVLGARVSALQQTAELADQSFATPADKAAALDRIYANAVSAVRTVAGENTDALLGGKVGAQLKGELQSFSRLSPPQTPRGKRG